MKTNLLDAEKQTREDSYKFFKTIEPDVLVDHFPLFVNRIELVRFLFRYEIFKKILNVKGSIVECGVHKGASLMLYAKLSAIYEPYALYRKVIGFDTFEGLPERHENDPDDGNAYQGRFNDTSLETIEKSIELFDRYRPNGHVEKVEVISGDACETVPKYFEENGHTLVALLYLDFDIYEPTKIALQTIVPRMPKGSIIVFDELNQKRWRGETIALLEEFDLNRYELRKNSSEPGASYIQL